MSACHFSFDGRLTFRAKFLHPLTIIWLVTYLERPVAPDILCITAYEMLIFDCFGMTRIALWLAHYQLKSKKPALRLRALKRLRTVLNDAVVALDDKITIALLDHVLTDPEAEIRRESAAILGDLRDVRAVPALVYALNDASETIQETAIQGLKKLDDSTAISPLVDKLKNGSPTVQWRAGQALKSLGWLPETNEEKIRFHIACGEIKQLTRFGSEAVKPLIGLLGKESSSLKIAAANVLGEIADPGAFKPMQPLLRDPDPLVRGAIIYAFERADFREAAPLIVPLLKEKARNVRLAAALVLGSLGDERAVEPLIGLLDDQDWEIRRAALESLGKLGDKRAFPSVAKHLEDSDKEVREVAADALGHVGNETIVEKLVFTMVDAHSGVRQAAARALTRIYPNWERSDRVKRLLPEIQSAMKNHDVSIQAAAVSLFQRVAGPMPGHLNISLSGLTGRPASPVVTLMRDLAREQEVDWRASAATVMGRINLKECEDDLKRLLEDANSKVQHAARLALARLASDETASSKVTFLSRRGEPPASEGLSDDIEDILVCSSLGEVLHKSTGGDLDKWLKFYQFICPLAEQLARLMKLGEIRQVVFQTPTAVVTTMIRSDVGLMFNRLMGGRPMDVPAGHVGKETVAEWLRQLPPAQGMLMRSVRFPDQTILCDVDSRDLTGLDIEEALRAVADTFQWLEANGSDASRIIWRGEKGVWHCARRADGNIAGMLASTKTAERETDDVTRRLETFQQLTAGGGQG